MANARIIRKNFFTDPIIAGKLPIKERYCLLGLTCYADDYGRFWWDARVIKATIFPTDSIRPGFINALLDKLDNQLGLVCKYEHNGQTYGHFVNWFVKGYALKQKLSHPRKGELHDCKIHKPGEYVSKKKPESSRRKEVNTNQSEYDSNQFISNDRGIKDKYHPSDFEEDTTGNSYLGYCSKCGETGFCDKRYGVYGDSKCCKSKILPSKALYEQLSVKSLE